MLTSVRISHSCYSRLCSLNSEEKFRKMLKWRAMERGMAENEIILRKYIDQYLPRMDTLELQNFSHFLNELDPDMYQWVSGQVAFPEKYELIGKRVFELTKMQQPTFATFQPVWEPEERN